MLIKVDEEEERSECAIPAQVDALPLLKPLSSEFARSREVGAWRLMPALDIDGNAERDAQYDQHGHRFGRAGAVRSVE